MLTGVTGSSRLCHTKGRSSGTSASTAAQSVPMWGQKTTTCFSSSAALTSVRMLSRDNDLARGGAAAQEGVRARDLARDCEAGLRALSEARGAGRRQRGGARAGRPPAPAEALS
jgi:hypothetical protein